MDDLEYPEIQALLSQPAESIPGQVARRRFLQGALASAGAFALLPRWMEHMAGAATPIGTHDGVIVVLQLGGGNDGMSMVVPRDGHADYSRYRSFRGSLAVSGALTLPENLGLNPRLPKLKARYDKGRVAIIRGVGLPVDDLSHFSSTATWMAGNSTSARDSGWLGRWLDGVPESADGLRAVQIGPSVPLHLAGRSSVVTAMDTRGDLFGADRSETWMPPVYDAVRAMGRNNTGRGRLADLIADTNASATALARRLSAAYTPALPTTRLVPDLTLAARLINLDLGLRVVSCSHGSYDLHDGHGYQYPILLGELDDAIDAFFNALDPAFHDRVTLMTFSEFGRTVRANGSGGTDHGTASPMLVIGEKVKGGLYGAQPRLDQLTTNGDLRVQVDYRSVYASVIDGWLAGGSSTILGGTFANLGLFKTQPGGPSAPPPSTPNPWKPFADPSTLIRQQYVDFLDRVPDDAGVAYWTGLLTTGGKTISWVINAFLNSNEFGVSVAPAARLSLACLGEPPAFGDLMKWADRVRAGDPLGDVAGSIVQRALFIDRYGSLSNSAFVTTAHRDATGTNPASSWSSPWVTSLGNGSKTRADVMAAIVSLRAAAAYLRPQVEVMMTYAGLLRRAPDEAGYAFWVGQVRSGASIQRLVAQFFASAEYQGRFD